MNFFHTLHLSSIAKIFALTLTTPLLSHGAWASEDLFNAPQPLAPEVAFAPEITDVQSNSITIRYSIEDEYYLYRDKLAFSVGAEPDASASIVLGAPVFEEATTINDDFFGEQAIFRGTTEIVLPYESDQSISNFTLNIMYQGCADIGLCYPPNTVALDVDLPDANAPVNSGGLFSAKQDVDASSSLVSVVQQSSSTQFFESDNQTDSILPPELAFLPQVVSAHHNAIELRWQIEDGYYLYRDKLSFSIEQADGLAVSSEFVSEGQEQFDEFFGNVHVLRDTADARLNLGGADVAGFAKAAPANGQLIINYQGCADIGVCFPPTTTTLPLSFSAGTSSPSDADLIALVGSIATNSGGGGLITTAETASASGALLRVADSPTLPLQSEQDRLTSLLGSSSIWLTIATFFGLGLLLAFTPCVLPMIPILSSLIVGQREKVSTGRAFQLSAVYVLVMASTYALVGIAVGLSGYNIQAFLQHPAVLTGIAMLFVVLSLSMFGFYELQMPTKVQNKLTQWSNKQGGGQFSGVAAMGFISTLIVGPCITAPLAGALLYIAKTGDAVVGGAALFALGLGMGAPLLLIGTSAGKLVPRAGAWMNTTKHIFGILMIAMAIYMLSRFLPSSVSMALYALLAIMSGVYLGAFERLTRGNNWQMIGKTAGIAVGLYGIALLVGALAGGGSYLKPLGGFTGTASGGGEAADHRDGEHALPFQVVKSVSELEQVIGDATAQGRPVMLDFYADWCISCKEMEAFTFTDNRVQQLLSNAIVLQADVTANDKLDKELLKHFDLFGPPGIIFYNSAGAELTPARVVGFMNADKFSTHIEGAIGRPQT